MRATVTGEVNLAPNLDLGGSQFTDMGEVDLTFTTEIPKTYAQRPEAEPVETRLYYRREPVSVEGERSGEEYPQQVATTTTLVVGRPIEADLWPGPAQVEISHQVTTATSKGAFYKEILPEHLPTVRILPEDAEGWQEVQITPENAGQIADILHSKKADVNRMRVSGTATSVLPSDEQPYQDLVNTAASKVKGWEDTLRNWAEQERSKTNKEGDTQSSGPSTQ
jgi:hypothetical protein